ncbi:ABC transporter substrate-binding protein [Mycobacterium deserti]|uniref:ABC transporter substrate-binding protein n=1 Tax=Mycobacterium deserti TaxID=2978347 RepID=A0ABT2MEJ2_9MYCO|nr:ABC transporter substrate-binding protein [Mycobacterium deserti]MCT7660695.1 ABC transporter substrate-binding protein [Mycobacterium deserti]
MATWGRTAANRTGAVRGMRPGALIAPLAVLAALVLAACSTTGATCGESACAAPMRVAYLDTVAALPVLVARQRGYFAEHDLDVQLTGVSNPPTAVQALGRSFDVVSGTVTDVSLADAHGRDVQIFAGAYEFSSATPQFDLIAHSDVGFYRELGGLKIGAPSLSGAVYWALLNSLAQAGLTARDVTIVQVAFPYVAAQLNAGVVDAALSVAPFSAGILQNPEYRSLGDPNLAIRDPLLVGVWAATSGWLSDNPGKTAAFVAAIEQAHGWIAANDTEARDTLVRGAGLPSAAAGALRLLGWRTRVAPADLQPWLDLLAYLDAAPDGQLPEADSMVFRP